jgi:hypothetical protein
MAWQNMPLLLSFGFNGCQACLQGQSVSKCYLLSCYCEVQCALIDSFASAVCNVDTCLPSQSHLLTL